MKRRRMTGNIPKTKIPKSVIPKTNVNPKKRRKKKNGKGSGWQYKKIRTPDYQNAWDRMPSTWYENQMNDGDEHFPGR